VPDYYIERREDVVNDWMNLDPDRRIDALGIVPTHHAYLGYARFLICADACARGYARAFDTHFVA
jgi:hypothetical protein